MKIGNVILALCLWLCIPAFIFLGLVGFAFSSVMGGSTSGGVCCVTIVPLALFVIGLILLIKGMENSSPKHVEYKVTSDRRCPSCGRVIPEDAKVCPYCGKRFEEVKITRKTGKNKLKPGFKE